MPHTYPPSKRQKLTPSVLLSASTDTVAPEPTPTEPDYPSSVFDWRVSQCPFDPTLPFEGTPCGSPNQDQMAVLPESASPTDESRSTADPPVKKA